MVRRCIVQNCKNIDTEILSHRFPKSPEQSKKWIESLEITDRTYDELAKCFVVCTIHFDKNDYRNELSNKLNSTAIPKLIGHTPRVSSKIITSPDDITPCLEDDETDNINTINMDSNSLHIIKPNLLIPITSQQQKISQVDLTPSSDATISDSHEILNISMESSILMYELTDSSNKHLIQYADDDSQKTDCGGEQHYESDVEIIDMNEINEELDQQQHQFKLDNVSGTVSFISSGGNTSPIYFDISDKNVTDHSCQVDTDELLKNFENNINDDGDDINCDNDEYQDMDRKQLIELIKEQKRKINEMDIKLKEFQKAHSKLVKSMDAFKMLIGSES